MICGLGIPKKGWSPLSDSGITNQTSCSSHCIDSNSQPCQNINVICRRLSEGDYLSWRQFVGSLTEEQISRTGNSVVAPGKSGLLPVLRPCHPLQGAARAPKVFQKARAPALHVGPRAARWPPLLPRDAAAAHAPHSYAGFGRWERGAEAVVRRITRLSDTAPEHPGHVNESLQASAAGGEADNEQRPGADLSSPQPPLPGSCLSLTAD